MKSFGLGILFLFFLNVHGLRLTVGEVTENPEAVLVQFDTRNPEDKDAPELLALSVKWNKKYVNQFSDHKYLFLNADDIKNSVDGEWPKSLPVDCHKSKHLADAPNITGPHGCELHAVWGKVRAMIRAQEMYPNAKYFMFMDSDMMVNYNESYMSKSIPDVFAGMQKASGVKPVYVTLDDNSWYTDQVNNHTEYKLPVNSGIVLWRGGSEALRVLKAWWESSVDKYEDFAIGGWQFRQLWPWDQGPMTVIANDERYKDVGNLIQVTPTYQCTSREHFPDKMASEEQCANFNRDDQCARMERIQQFVRAPETNACYALHFTDDGPLGVEEYKGAMASPDFEIDRSQNANFILRTKSKRQQAREEVMKIYRQRLLDP